MLIQNFDMNSLSLFETIDSGTPSLATSSLIIKYANCSADWCPCTDINLFALVNLSTMTSIPSYSISFTESRNSDRLVMKFIAIDCQGLSGTCRDCRGRSGFLDFFVLLHTSHFLTYFLIFFLIFGKKYFSEILVHVAFVSL